MLIIFYILYFETIWVSPICNGENILSPGRKPMLFVGVYQESLAGSSYCQSAMRKSDEWKEEFWKSIIGKFQHVDNLMNFDDFTYTERTFTDVDQLVDTIIDLKLNQSYFVDDKREHDPTWNRINIKSWNTTSRIMIVFLYADEQGSLVASKLLYGEDYVVFLLNQNNMGSIIGDSNIHSTNDFLKTNLLSV